MNVGILLYCRYNTLHVLASLFVFYDHCKFLYCFVYLNPDIK